MANMQMNIARFGPKFACAHLLPCNKGRLIVCEFYLSDDNLDVINLLIGARAAGKLDPLRAESALSAAATARSPDCEMRK